MLKRTLIFGMCMIFCPLNISAQNAKDLVEKSFQYMRGNTSIATINMTIQRQSWKRKIVMQAWTKGQLNSIFHIISPVKDKGNGTLKTKDGMWVYNPQVNRVIKIPPSMMSQAWMGSDFSNNDLSKTDSILKDYSHTIVGKEKIDGKIVYVIKLTPYSDAPVVWAMQKIFIREDYIILKQEFYNEDLALVKTLSSSQINNFYGKLFPKVWKMKKNKESGHTTVVYEKLRFDKNVPDSVFTLSNLKNSNR